MVEIDNEHFEKIISLTENYILNSKYYKTENDFINFEPPAYPTEIIDNK
jgi:hypothetical protein